MALAFLVSAVRSAGSLRDPQHGIWIARSRESLAYATQFLRVHMTVHATEYGINLLSCGLEKHI
jgi:hypothetical protein